MTVTLHRVKSFRVEVIVHYPENGACHEFFQRTIAVETENGVETITLFADNAENLIPTVDEEVQRS